MASIHYTNDFTFLKNLFDDHDNWTGSALSGLDIETEVNELPDGRKSGLNPHDGEVATVQIENAGEVWVVHVPAGNYLAGLPGAAYFRRYLECREVTKVIHNAIFEHSRDHLQNGSHIDGRILRTHWRPPDDPLPAELVANHPAASDAGDTLPVLNHSRQFF